MRVLIIGGAGLLGLELAKLYASNGNKVAICDNFTGSITYRTPKDYQLFTANACDHNSLSNVFRHFSPEIVIIASNYSFNRDIIYNQHEDSRSVLSTTSAVCTLLQKSVKKVIFCSSHEVYGGPESKVPLKENRKIVMSSTAQGAAKLASENIFKFHCNQRGVELINFRIFNLYGPRIKFTPRSCVVNFLIESFLRGEGIGVAGPDLKRDFIHSQDAAALMRSIEVAGGVGEFNIGTGVGTTLRQLISFISNHLSIKEPPVFLKSPSGFSAVADLGKVLKVVPSWKPVTVLSDYLPELIEFRKKELEFFSLKDPVKVLDTMRGLNK